MNELNDVEQEMKIAMAEHKFRVMLSVVNRLTQMGFHFKTEKELEHFLKDWIVFSEVMYQDITEVFLLDEANKETGTVIMQVKTTPDLT